MAGTYVKVLFNKLPAAALKLKQRSGQISQQSAYRIRDDAKIRCPVDTGRLRDEIEAVKGAAFTWTVISPTEYAVYIEYGTVRAPAQPYLTPAAEAERSRFLDALDTVLDQLV